MYDTGTQMINEVRPGTADRRYPAPRILLSSSPQPHIQWLRLWILHANNGSKIQKVRGRCMYLLYLKACVCLSMGCVFQQRLPLGRLLLFVSPSQAVMLHLFHCYLLLLYLQLNFQSQRSLTNYSQQMLPLSKANNHAIRSNSAGSHYMGLVNLSHCQSIPNWICNIMLCQLFLRIHLTDKTTNQANAIPSTQDFTFFKLKWSQFLCCCYHAEQFSPAESHVKKRPRSDQLPACPERVICSLFQIRITALRDVNFNGNVISFRAHLHVLMQCAVSGGR